MDASSSSLRLSFRTSVSLEAGSGVYVQQDIVLRNYEATVDGKYWPSWISRQKLTETAKDSEA